MSSKKSEKYTAIANHPHKEKIDTWLMGGLSYRDVEKKIVDLGCEKISYQTLRRYHKESLGGSLAKSDGDGGGSALPSFPTSLEINKESITGWIEDVWDDNYRSGFKERIKKPLLEIYLMQTQITLQAIQKHVDGECKYPSEYVSKLNTLFSMLMK